jgi:SAM-dependent methyltransferase
MDKAYKINNVSSFWDSCKSTYAHLKNDHRVISKGNKLEETLHKIFLDCIDFKNKTVIDYGCGGGFLGKYLFEEKEIKKYIAYDISKRSLSFARKTIGNKNSEFILVEDGFYFENNSADVFISLACIQHFPDKYFLDYFTKKVNESKCKFVVLQYRYNDETVFNSAYEYDDGDTRLACMLDENYFKDNLTNYKLVYDSEKQNGEYVYTIFELIK